MAKDRIYIDDWLDLKPYKKQQKSDSYYIELSNRIYDEISQSKVSFVLLVYIDKMDLKYLSCFLASYFEDLISQTNLWTSFVNKHKELYNKALPFYNTREYYSQEINKQDVVFLIWYVLHHIQREKFIAPSNGFLFDIAELVYDIFDAEWEYAPENDSLKAFYTIDQNETDYYIARKLIDNVLFGSYLFNCDTGLILMQSELELLNSGKMDYDMIDFLRENRDSVLHKARTSLLAMRGNEWAAELVGKEHPLYEDFLNISQKISGFFLYKGQDNNDVFIEHIASGEEFKLTKKSFDHYEELKVIDTILFMGIVKWMNEWWFSGIYFNRPFDPDLVLDEKNSMQSRQEVSFLHYNDEETQDMMNQQLHVFKKFNNNSQIAYLKTDEIEGFVKDYYQYYNDSLNLSTKEIKYAEKRAKDDGYFHKEDFGINLSTEIETGLVFFNPNSGIEIAFDINSAFPDAKNSFYNKELSDDHVLHLLVNSDMSKELVMYSINNFKDSLQFYNTDVGKLYLENIDFLIRFWKKTEYYSYPKITFTGKKT